MGIFSETKLSIGLQPLAEGKALVDATLETASVERSSNRKMVSNEYRTIEITVISIEMGIIFQYQSIFLRKMRIT